MTALSGEVRTTLSRIISDHEEVLRAAVAVGRDRGGAGVREFILRYRADRLLPAEAESLLARLQGTLVTDEQKEKFLIKTKLVYMALLNGQDPNDLEMGPLEAVGIEGDTLAKLANFLSNDEAARMGMEQSSRLFFGSGFCIVMSLGCLVDHLNRGDYRGAFIDGVCTVGSGLQFGSLIATAEGATRAARGLATAGGVVGGAGGILTGLNEMYSAGRDFGNMGSIQDRYKEAMSSRYGPTIYEAFEEDQYLRLSWHKILERIGRRKTRDVVAGTGGTITTTGGALGICAAVGAGGAAVPVAGWVLSGVAAAVAIGLVSYRVGRHLHKEKVFEKLKTKLAEDGITPPHFCNTTGDYYRYKIADYIFKKVASQDAIGSLLGYIILGGTPQTAGYDVLNLDISGLMAYLHG